MSDDAQDETIYEIVVNAEQQFSLWRADRDAPPGWNYAGKRGTVAECLQFIRDLNFDVIPNRRPGGESDSVVPRIENEDD